MLSRLLNAASHTWAEQCFKLVELPYLAPRRAVELARRIAAGDCPRIAFVKQDVHEDLYCCGPQATPREIVASTLMRTGPVELFRTLQADFHLVRTEDDRECNVWRQKWTECGWCPIEWYEGFRRQVPGRSYGQADFAVAAETIDWGQYEIVISVDVSVPARITRDFPQTLWCYYIREPKTSAYRASMTSPIAGQDVFLNQYFRTVPPKQPGHVLEFPYYLQSYGCFHDLFCLPKLDGERRGMFLDHHTAGRLTRDDLRKLERFGPVASTAVRRSDGTFEATGVKSRMKCEEIISALARSKYFLQIDTGRRVFGNATVEAICSGCLALGDPGRHVHGFLFNQHTTTTCIERAAELILALEADRSLYKTQVGRQRELIDYICYVRPIGELLNVDDPRKT